MMDENINVTDFDMDITLTEFCDKNALKNITDKVETNQQLLMCDFRMSAEFALIYDVDIIQNTEKKLIIEFQSFRQDITQVDLDRWRLEGDKTTGHIIIAQGLDSKNVRLGYRLSPGGNSVGSTSEYSHRLEVYIDRIHMI